MFFCEFYEISKNTFFHRPPPVAASKCVNNRTGFVRTFSEAATRGVLCEKVFLENLQNSQENACARAFFLIKLHNKLKESSDD